jgi:hypothetical protein
MRLRLGLQQRLAPPGLAGMAVMAVMAVMMGALGASSCGQTVDFKQALQVTEFSGGWYDFGIVDGKNKLVPLVRFRIKKEPSVRLRGVDVNIHFKWIAPEAPASKEAEVELADVFLQDVEFVDGAQTALLTVQADNGFTGDPPQSRAEMLAHRLFKDVRVRIFAKQSSTTWVELASHDIPRTLVTK